MSSLMTGLGSCGCPPTTNTRAPLPHGPPDGSRIAYHSDLFGYEAIYSVRPDGSDPRLLTGGTHDTVSTDPAWSPDGSHIVFTRVVDRYGSTDLFIMRADGGDVRRLLERPGIESRPSWSPEGNRIAFGGTGPRVGDDVSWSFPGNDVYVLPAGGGAAAKLTETGVDGAPDWAPDGSAIVFESDRDAAPGTSRLDLYLMDPAGNNERRLTTIGCLQCNPDWARLPEPSTGSGPQTIPQGSPLTPAPRSVKRFRVVPRQFRWAAAGRVRIVFVLSRPGRVRFALTRVRQGKAALGAKARRATRRGRAGTNRFVLKRLFPRRLKPGRYRLTVATLDGASRAKATFRVRRPAS